ncbi:SNF2 family N-terminal domain-containing protein [Endogone sp. FLAS-F59071]|nr:SNF2 family N-terminal domain-containing protein [Endogone sp. FLAS-F59071]|eukprot:RUS14420.1 SNF2 family N-terminal domain-containing protein [Endogone sp. FLAS-F59071]
MGLGKTIEILSLIHVNRPTFPLPSTTPTPSRTASPTTLIICPMSLLAQWRDELLRGSAPGSLTVDVYYGGAKDRHLCESCTRWDGRAPDVVVTSYGTVMSEWCAEMGERKEGVFGIEWWRIVLDEAHQIKGRITKTAKSCFALAAQRRWVVTGTPIQNKLEDLFSLVHFLRAEPWSNYTFWRTHISIPFQSKDARALNVVQTVLEPLVLRRTKAMKGADGNALVKLPEKTIDVEFLEFSQAEQEVYDNLFNVSKKQFSTLVGQGKVLSQYACIFQLLMRLRQICDHPYLVLGNKNAKGEEVVLKEGAVSLDNLVARFDAANGGPSYGASVLQRLMTGDGDVEEHDVQGLRLGLSAGGLRIESFPFSCFTRICLAHLDGRLHDSRITRPACPIQKRENEGEEGQCPICRQGLTEGDLIEVVKNRPSSSDSSGATVSLRHSGSFRSSTKINALLRHLTTWRREKPQVKVVVFSQFTSLLNLVELALEREGVDFVRLDGTMSQLGREKVLKEFKEGKMGVLLISLKAGGVGLNLTCASRVVMMNGVCVGPMVEFCGRGASD